MLAQIAAFSFPQGQRPLPRSHISVRNRSSTRSVPRNEGFEAGGRGSPSGDKDGSAGGGEAGSEGGGASVAAGGAPRALAHARRAALVALPRRRARRLPARARDLR